MECRDLLKGFVVALCLISHPFIGGAQEVAVQAGEAATARGPHLVALATERIDRDCREVRVFSARRPVELPRFHELLVARAGQEELELDKLTGHYVTIVPSRKVADLWEVYADTGWGVGPTLAGNVFCVKKILPSTSAKPLEVHVNGELYRLKSGEVLIVLG
jgi:hypothetical protein